MQKHSTVEVLGCSGSIGIPRQGTTSFLIDDDILIDAGTGVCELPFERLEKIKHVFLTHSHLDHICSLPFLVDTVGVGRTEPLLVYGLEHTIASLRSHIFNEAIWPDFTKIPNPENPVMEYRVIGPNDQLLMDERVLSFVEVNHTVPAVGVCLTTPTGGWAFSGDTHETSQLYSLINQLDRLDVFFIESAFPNKEKWLADLSKHLCPSLMFSELEKLREDCEVWVSHLKPREAELISRELENRGVSRAVKVLSAGMKFGI
ncbi:MAG: 3',5'-cyclic-nucleotide phosphodiesterase [Limnobacter sp.]|nr:3',5'-cyclic-nucleotide phosphodiesterase [Limnobacter sp.]